MFQHCIARPKNVATPEPLSRNDRINLKVSDVLEEIVPPGTLLAEVMINTDSLLPDWDGNWPAQSRAIPFIHGVEVRDSLGGQPYLGSALKVSYVELQFAPLSGLPLVAPRINQRTSPTLGIAQFIDYRGSDIARSDNQSRNRQPLRMNTLFARTLIEKVDNALENLLSWETQQQLEPPLDPASEDNRMDFNGANGLYFWELFLHLPFMVAHRLHLEQNFDEVESWLSFIFDPNRRSDVSGRPDYWNVRPLDDREASDPDYATRAPLDPDGIASSYPVHYRRAVYSFFVKNLIARGDSAYRQLTPDSLGAAKLWYVRVLDLLGPRPDIHLTDHWTPISLEQLVDTTNPVLREYESRRVTQNRLQLESLENGQGPSHWRFAEPALQLRTFAPDPTLLTLDSPYLRPPMNAELVRHWDTCEKRLENLRSNRSIDGRPLSLPLFAAPLNPRALLAAFGQGVATGGIGRLQNPEIPHYRFLVQLRLAKEAVTALTLMGATLLSLAERKDAAQYMEDSQQAVLEVAPLLVALKEQSLIVAQEKRKALLASQATVQQRLDFYTQRSNRNTTSGEQTAGALYRTAFSLDVVSKGAEAIAKAIKVAPSGGEVEAGVIAGVANGVSAGAGMSGLEWEGVAESVADLFKAGSIAYQGSAETLDRFESYRRRLEEWQQSRDQSDLELLQVAAELKVLDEEDKVLQQELEEVKLLLTQHQGTYDFLIKRFTSSQLFQWLQGQHSRFYNQVYDATLSLCFAAQAAFQYERGDFSASFIRTDTWNDSYRGLGVGESLRANLLRMENAYMSSHERPLEILKTVSLAGLKDKAPASTINKDWAALKKGLQDSGSVEFELTQTMFDEDYPKQYQRRIVTVSVSLPGATVTEDVRAILSQTYNRIEMRASEGELALENLRSSQQIALSSDTDDSGLFTLNFSDERYLPFEMTGAVSKWKLEFPNHSKQSGLIASLTDIIVKVRYTARFGG